MGLERNDFFPKTVRAEVGLRRVHRICCSECPTTNEVSANTHSGTRHVNDLIRVWTRGGWTVGKKSSEDLCPQCTSDKRNARRKSHEIPKSEQPEAIAMTKTPAPIASIAPDIDRSSRRIIFEKLNEVYLDEGKGYSSGWTDQKVADDLGIARAWVEHIRAEFFGVEKGGVDTEALREEWGSMCLLMDALKAETKEALKKASEAADAAKLLTEKHNELNRKMADMAKRMQDIAASLAA